MYCDGRCQYLNEREHKCELTGEKLTYMKQTGSISFSVHEHRGFCKGKRWNVMENRHLCKARPIGTRKQWVTGFYAVLGEKTVIIVNEPEKFYDVDSGEISHGNKIVEVIPNTICQCTGYEGIYEKDIFRYEDEDYVIKWSDDSLRWEATSLETDVSVPLGDINPDYIDVIGNEIDNPELLEV